MLDPLSLRLGMSGIARRAHGTLMKFQIEIPKWLIKWDQLLWITLGTSGLKMLDVDETTQRQKGGKIQNLFTL